METPSSWVSPSLLEITACPDCKGPLKGFSRNLQCVGCGRAYPIRNGIAVLLPDAETRDEDLHSCDLSVLILAYNEGRNLEKLLPSLLQVLRDLGCSSEVVVLDGGSKDDTVDQAVSHGARVVVQRAPGYGNAFREGIAACQGEHVLTLDSDTSHDPGFIRSLWQQRANADLVVGSRYVYGAEAEMTPFRRGLSLFMNGVFRRVLSIPLYDLSSGFRLYRRELLRNVPLRGTEFDVLVELLVQVFARGWKISEIPMYYKPRLDGRSNLRVVRAGLSYWRSLRRLWPLRNSINSADYDFRAFHSRIPLQRYWQQQRLRAVKEFLSGRTENILDVGCGSSKILQSLPSAVGLDICLEKLRFMQRTNALLVTGDAHHLPFLDGTFETVICSQMIEHVPDTERILRELRRVLKTGGYLILGTPDYATWQWRVVEPIYHRVLPDAYAGEHVTHFTRESVVAALRTAGFEIMREQYVCGAEWIGLAQRLE